MENSVLNRIGFAYIGAFSLPLRYALVIVCISAVLLIGTEVILNFLSCLIVLLLLFIHLPNASGEVLAGFQSTIPYFLIAVIGLGQAVLHSALGDSFYAIMSRLLIKTRIRLPLLLFFLVIPMALVVSSSTPRNAILAPLVDRFIDRFHLERDGTPSLLVLGFLNTMASSLFLTGGLSALITSKLIGDFSWFGWLIWMAPAYLIFMALGMTYLGIRYFGFGQPRFLYVEKVEKVDFPYFKREDCVICIALLLVVGLWITDHWHGLDPLVCGTAVY